MDMLPARASIEVRLTANEGLLNQENVKLLLDPGNLTYIQAVIKFHNLEKEYPGKNIKITGNNRRNS
jgi:hypothetical protein